MPAQTVNVDTFVRAETHRMFSALQRDAGGVNRFRHSREPTPIDQQTVIRMNRDTLYSFAVVDISQGAVFSLPEAGERYLSAMVVNEDYYINRVFHGAGEYRLAVEEFDTPHVLLAVRTMVDPRDPEDLVAVAALQDQLSIHATADRPFSAPAMTKRPWIAPAQHC
jgi:hypothetical protein